MNKFKLALIICIAVAMILTMAILPGCKTATTAGTTAAPETVVVTETVIVKETVEVEKQSPYTYEKLREMAKAGKYEGEPAKGHTLAFANFLASFPFCKSVEDSIKQQWKLAGGADSDLTVLDNAYDIGIAAQNTDIIFNKKPEVFLQFFFDSKFNAQTSRRATDLGIYCIAIDIPLPGFPFMGVDNYGTAILTGNWAAEKIDAMGGIDKVDKIFLFYAPQIGEVVFMRILGSVDVMKEKYGAAGDPGDPTTGEKPEGSKAEWVLTGSTTDEAKAAFTDILAKYPEAKSFVVFMGNDQTSAGVQAAADIAGRWDPNNWLICSQGVDELGMQLIRDGVVDGDSAYFPEKYGEYLVPGALAYMYGNPVQPYMYVDNVIITADNINDYYPQ